MSGTGTIPCPFTGAGYNDPNNPITSNYCCFTTGTQLLGALGYINVENIRVGDVLVSLDNLERRVEWVGYRKVRLSGARELMPIRIMRGAFADNVPSRDLIVSPEHALFFDGVLIPASSLVNGSTIARVALQEVTYYHIELDRHAVVYAQGLGAESFLNTGLSVSFFANSTSPTQLHASSQIVGSRKAVLKNWLKAKIAGAGTRAYRSASSLGLHGFAQAMLDMSLVLDQRISGACAPRAHFGAAVERAKAQLNARATLMGVEIAQATRQVAYSQVA